MGLLKGTFQSLKELRIQIELILWVRCCIILHNLIIRIEEGTGIDNEWREATIQEGLQPANPQDQNHGGNDQVDEDNFEDEQQTGQAFRSKVMTDLFDSEHSTAQRR